MITLKNITNKNGFISCEAYIEDCSTRLPLVLDISKREFEDFLLPTGYEWCQSHIAHAKFKLLKMLEENNLSKECTIMWY